MKIHIETSRFLLRDIEQDDVLGIFELDSDAGVHQYLGNHPIKSLEEAQEIINYIQGQYKQYGIGRWAIIEKETNEFIGWTGLKFETEVRDDMDYYDLGYRLKKKFWGQGIASETAFLSLEYGFQNMDLPIIYAGAHIDNIGSNKILQKVGMQLLEVFEYDGMSHNWYRLKKEEWMDRN